MTEERKKIVAKLWEEDRKELIGTLFFAFAILGVSILTGDPETIWYARIDKFDWLLEAILFFFVYHAIIQKRALGEHIDTVMDQNNRETSDVLRQINRDVSNIQEEIEEIQKVNSAFHSSQDIVEIVEHLNGERLSWAKYVVQTTVQNLTRIKDGIIDLTESQFFDELTKEMDLLGQNDTVRAISAYKMERWEMDKREIKYFKANVRAINRGAKIHRVFLFRKSELKEQTTIETLRNQDVSGVTVQVVFHHSLNRKNIKNINLTELRAYDAIKFDTENPRVYQDWVDEFEPTRIERGELQLSTEKIEEFEDYWSALMDYVITDDELREILASDEDSKQTEKK